MSLKLADGTRTWEQLIAVDREMARLNGKTARMHVKVDKSDLDQTESVFKKLGDLFGGGHSFNLPFTSMTANPAGVAAIGAGIAALVPELVGVVSGFAAAGAGAAAFAALAAPAVKHVTTAYSNLKSAQNAYNAAKQKEQLDPSKANAAALVKAADNLKLVQKQISQMPAAEQAAVIGISNLSSAYGKMSKAFEPKAFEVFASGLRLVSTLLPHLTPFANTFADSLSKILGNLDKSAKGKGFQDFLKQFHGIEGPALQAIGAGIGNVAGSVGRLLTVMNGKDVAHTLNIAFSGISGTIGGITTSVKFLMQAWDGMGLAAHNVAGAFDGIRHGLSGVGADIKAFVKGGTVGLWDGLWNGAKEAVSKTVSFFSGLGGKVKGAVSGAAGWLISTGQAAIGGFLRGAKADWNATNAWLNSIPGKVKAVFSGAGGWLKAAGEAIMGGLLAGIRSAWGKVASFLSSLAGKIKSLKGPLDYDRIMLYPHGQAIMQGLMGGMQSQVPALENQLRGITNTISQAAGNNHGGHSGGEIVNHVHVHLDGREIYSQVQKRSIQTQRRTGSNGMQKRTR